MTARQTAINTLVVAAIIAAGFVLWKVRLVVLLLLMAILLSAAIEPFVFWLRRIGVNRSRSILLVYLVIVATVGVAVLLGQRVVLSQAQRLIESYPLLVEKGQDWAQTLKNEYVREMAMEQFDYLASFRTPIEALGIKGGDVARYALGTVVGIITTFVICFYWISEKPLLRRLLLTWTSDEKRELITRSWNNVEQKLGGWVRGEFILCSMIGLGSFVGYMLLGVEYAFLLAVLAGITEIIPVIGPYIGIIPATMIGLMESMWLGAAVFAYGIALQFVENNFLVPRVMNKSVGLTPLSVMLSLMIGGILFGVVGALLAVPIAAAITALLEDLVQFHHERHAKEGAQLVMPVGYDSSTGSTGTPQ